VCVCVCVCVCVDVCLDVNQSNKPLHTETCNLAYTDLLMNLDRVPKPGQTDLL